MAKKQKVEWTAGISVGVILSNRPYDEVPEKILGEMILVQKRKTLKWGIPAGHVEAGETAEKSACRELWEETKITIDDLENFSQIPGLREIPHPKRTEWGIWYEGNLKNPISKEGRRIDSQEILQVKPWGIDELLKLESSGGDQLFIPEFNLAAIRHYLDRVFYTPIDFR